MPKRQVSYNPKAVLCPGCTKRIRLNNNGRLRVHRVGRLDSENCEGSDRYVTKDGSFLSDEDIEALATEAEAGYDTEQLSPVFMEP